MSTNKSSSIINIDQGIVSYISKILSWDSMIDNEDEYIENHFDGIELNEKNYSILKTMLCCRNKAFEIILRINWNIQ